ncbi:hypothetical protein PHET_10038, partial [Paragonimus heterotremus]
NFFTLVHPVWYHSFVNQAFDFIIQFEFCTARSPMFSWVNVTIQGLPCIRAAGTQPYQLQTFDELVDKHTSVFYANIAAARWLSIRLDLLCWIFITAVVAICLLLGTFSTIAGASVGLMITYATGLVGLFQWCVRQSAEVENQMVSVERTVEYMDLEPEVTQPPVIAPPEGWPNHGKIVFDRLWLRYQTGDTWALKDITLEIRPGLKVRGGNCGSYGGWKEFSHISHLPSGRGRARQTVGGRRGCGSFGTKGIAETHFHHTPGK